MSPAKKMPASRRVGVKWMRLPAAASCARINQAHVHRKGAASAMRQNAEAIGLTSERRIMMPAKPMAMPPDNRAAKARAGTVREFMLDDGSPVLGLHEGSQRGTPP